MLTDVSAVLGLPYIQPAQAQKHVTHNEALAMLDLLVQPVVASRQAGQPPEDPLPGTRHIVPAGATGEFAGQEGRIALWDSGGWSFLSPRPGWRAEVLDEGCAVVFDGMRWLGPDEQVQRAAGLGIATPADAVNRLAVAAPATLLTHAGEGHQLKVNKAAPSDTASLLFQTGWSGRAEMGLAGEDDFSVKTSADGDSFRTALRIPAGTGRVEAPAGLGVAAGSAAVPGIAFLDGGDAGLFSPAPGEIGLAAGGAQRAGLSASALAVNVPVTGTAVTQTPRDRTAGRLVKVGDYGLGGAQPLGGPTSLQALELPPGNYSYMTGGALTGGPESATRAHALQVVEISSSTTGSTRRRMYVSARVAPSMSDCRVWIGFNTAADPIAWMPLPVGAFLVGTVSQAGGLPTGAAMERGANANGEYVRFADGTQICQRIFDPVACTTAIGSVFMHADLIPWTYPAAFAAPPTVSGGAGSAGRWIGVSDSGVSGGSFRVLSAALNADERSPRLTAIGRWY